MYWYRRNKVVINNPTRITEVKPALDWDIYFLRLAKEVSHHSKCMSRQIGAVLVKDKNIVSTGYNGPATGVAHCSSRSLEFYFSIHGETKPNKKDLITVVTQCPRKYFGYKSGQGLHLCQAGHAERNALIQAAKHGIATKGASLYCYCGQVCKDCAIEIINAGIKELVFLEGQEDYDNYAKTILKESGITIRKIPQAHVDKSY